MPITRVPAGLGCWQPEGSVRGKGAGDPGIAPQGRGLPTPGSPPAGCFCRMRTLAAAAEKILQDFEDYYYV